MASKLELRFTSEGIAGQTFTVKTGKVYTFKAQRLGVREVAIGSPTTLVKAEQLAANFKDAFNQDDNLNGEYTVNYSVTATDANGTQLTPSGTFHGIVTLEHFDNTHFDTYSDGAGFIDATLTTTTQESKATLDVTLSNSPTDTCGKFNLNVQSNVISGRFVIEIPVGTVIVDAPTSELPYNIDRIRPANATTGIVKLYNTEFTETTVREVLFNPPPVLSISSIDVKASPFGAVATINATSGLVKTYSFDNVTYSGSNQLGGLLAGNYTGYVKDEFGCQKSKTFTVTADQVTGLSVPELFEIPLHNSMRFANRSQDNFLGYLSGEIPANAKARVTQDWLTTDSPRNQFKSSFKNHTITIFDCNGNAEQITAIQKSDNINRYNIYEGNYTAKEGRLAVYFTSGNIYETDGVTPKPEGHILNGRLPVWYKSGLYLKIEGIGVTQIERILYKNDTAYAITQLDSGATVTNVPITSIHSEHPYEVWEFDVNMNRPEGEYLIAIDYGTYSQWSEIQRVSESLPKSYLKTSWRNLDLNDQLVYSTGIKPFRRLKYDKYFTYIGQNEREIHEAETTIKLINSKSKAVYELEYRATSMELAHGLIDGLNHAGEIEIDGAVFICNSSATPESAGNWYRVKTELALIGQTVESIEADYTQINVQFLKVSTDPNGVGFLQV